MNSVVGIGTSNQHYNVQVKPPLADVVGLSQLSSDGTRMVFTDGLVVKEDSHSNSSIGFSHLFVGIQGGLGIACVTLNVRAPQLIRTFPQIIMPTKTKNA